MTDERSQTLKITVSEIASIALVLNTAYSALDNAQLNAKYSDENGGQISLDALLKVAIQYTDIRGWTVAEFAARRVSNGDGLPVKPSDVSPDLLDGMARSMFNEHLNQCAAMGRPSSGTWEGLPEGAKEVFRQQAAAALRFVASYTANGKSSS